MSTTPEDITDSLIYGYVPKEDIIRYNRNDDFFTDFKITQYEEFDLDDDDEFDELEKGETFNGCWLFENCYGLGVTQRIRIHDNTNQCTICEFKLLGTDEIECNNLYDIYPYPILEEDIFFDYGKLLLHKQFNITSRQMLKEVIQTHWHDFCKEALDIKIIYGNCYAEQLDKIHERYEVMRLRNHIPTYSHHELRKFLKDYYNNVITIYPYEINCRNIK
jgi:hypothetical protein